MRYLLGIDIGTTGTKGILLDPQRGCVAEAARPAQLRAPQAGWAEADPNEWWANVGTVCRELLAQSGAAPASVAAVGVSGMVPALVLLDDEGRVLRPSIQQNDARAHAEVDFLKARTDEADMLERTGSPISQQSIGPKLRWLRSHEPERLARAVRILGSYDYINLRLTGAFTCERNWALESGLYNLPRAEWDGELLALAGICAEQLGAVRMPAELIGQVTPEAAAHTGLLAGTPVVAGSADHVASAFSAGLRQNGELLVKLGGAGDVLYVLDRPQPDTRLFIDYHIIPELYLLNGCMAASGSIIKWFQQQLAGADDYAELDAQAERVGAGSDGLVLLPYFIGEKTPIFDPFARGVFFGLGLEHSRAHLYRAVLEGISYGFYHHLAVLRELGHQPASITVVNGGSRSRLWRQITCDVLGLPLRHIAQHPGSSLGAAFVAGVGAGIFREWDEIDRFIQVAQVHQPEQAAHARYRRYFELYRSIYAALRPQFDELARIREQG